MSLILLRYGEIGLKGKNRKFFFRKLRRNVRRCLQAHGIEGKVWQEGQRIYLQTDELESAVEAVQRVFGLVSLSPVYEVPANPEAIVQEGVMVAQRAGLDAGRTFRVRARRADKSFPLISPEIERQVGEAIVLATGARPDLSKEAQVEIGVEVQPGRALIFGETIAGPGGLPLGSQGRVVALLSSGIDSPVAAWLMMKRGCGVIPVHFTTSQAQTEQVEAIVEALNRHAYGWQLRPIILSHEEALEPVLARLREMRRERWTCLFCKRVILSKAAEIAEEMGASALVTGDSLGQVASQTLNNLEVISYGMPKPILRPLIGMDKTEIMDLARRIGTYDASIKSSHACPFLPDRPLTQARMEKLHELLAQMEEMDVHQPKTGDSGRLAADVS
jgi:thiamine biosynthesis protein ThiI